MRRLACICFLLPLVWTANALALEIFGTWTNSQFGVSMILNRDGTFVFQGPQSTSNGFWAVEGNVIAMQDQWGQVIRYTITGFSATQLNLIDLNGAALN